MNTYKIKMGDVVKFPNGIEINYDESTESLVVLHPTKILTLRPERAERTDNLSLSKGIWLIGVGS